MLQKPYIGITGITTFEQIDILTRMWKKLKCQTHNLMMGFLVGYKELSGIKHDNPRYVQLFNGELESLLNSINDPTIMKVVHYNTRNQNFSLEIGLFNGLKIDGFQLNISNPNPNEVRFLKKTYPHKIILQINHSLLNDLDKIHAYPEVEYYLIDPSSGRGKEISFEYVEQTIKSLELPLNKIGIAGGLSPDNIKEFAQRFPNCCFDAESQLRTNDLLDIDKCINYLFNFKEGINNGGHQKTNLSHK